MAKEFQITDTFTGYTNALEETNSNPQTLSEGSKNVIINLEGSVSTRRGFYSTNVSTDGGNQGITGATEWSTSRGDYYMLRKYGNTLELLINAGNDDAGNPKYDNLVIHDDDTAGNIMKDAGASFATVWDDDRQIDQLIITSGTENTFWSWSGALGIVAATDASTITLDKAATDKDTWGETGLYFDTAASEGKVTINGTEYTFTGGIDTDTLTGVTPDPSGEAAGSYAIEKTKKHTVTDFGTVDFSGVFRNGLYLGSKNSRVVIKSNAVDFTDFTTSTAVGGGRELTIDDNCAGFAASKDSMLIFGQNDSIFNQKYQISSDHTKEYYEISRLSTAAQQGLITPSAKRRIKNSVVYITNDKTLDTVEFVENINEQQNVPLSDLIKNDFDALDFENANVSYWQRNILISVPKNSRLYIYDLQRDLWQPPIEYNGATIRHFSIDDDGTLIGHDAFTTDSYVLFNGTNDDGESFDSIAKFAYNNFGARFNQKRFTHYVQDGYISRSGELSITLDYDFEGSTASETREFSAEDTEYIFSTDDSGGLGHAHLGGATLGGSELTPPSQQQRFRFSDAYTPKDFYELQVTYAMSDKDANFRLVSHGGDVVASSAGVGVITRV